MSPEIIQKALEQVLSGMKSAAMKGKAGMFAKPTASPGVDESPAEDQAISPLGADAGMAGDAASENPDEDPAEEADPNDPTDDELEALMQK